MNSLKYVVLLVSFNVALWAILSITPRINKYKKRIFIVLSFVLLWLFLSIREPYSDMITYDNYFHSINVSHFETVFQNRWEILFKVLLFGIRAITNHTHVMMAIIAFITLLGPFLFIKRYSKNYLLSVVMFITIGTFSMQFYVIRQAIALSIFLMAFHYIGEKKLLKYILAIIVAALFHKTALILLLIYPLINIPPSKYKNIVVAVLALLTLIFEPIVSNLLIMDFYEQYSDKVISGDGIALFSVYVLMYAVYAILSRRINEKEKIEIKGLGLFTVFLQFFSILNNLFSRIVKYSRNSFVILIPNLVQRYNVKSKIFFSIILIIACICFAAATNPFEGYSF